MKDVARLCNRREAESPGRRSEIGGCLRACVEEFEGARGSVGVLKALAFVSLLVAITLVGLVVSLILGVLLLALFPVALLIGLVAMLVSWSKQAGRGVGKPPTPDPWLSE